METRSNAALVGSAPPHSSKAHDSTNQVLPHRR